MSKKIKLLAGLMSTIIVASTFIGCGTKAETVQNTEKSGQEITIWTKLWGDEIKVLEDTAAKWGEKTGNTVKIVNDEADYQSFLQAANSTKGPDLVYGIAHDHISTFQSAGLLEEVPEGMFNKEDYINNTVWDAGSFNGKNYAVPIAMETVALFYNKDKVKEVPETMEELIEQAKAHSPNGFQFNINDFYVTGGFVQSLGGYIFGGEPGNLDPNDVGLDNEGAIKAYTFLGDLVNKHKFMPVDMTADIAKSNFSAQESIFYISGAWDVQPLKETGVNVGVAELPTLEGNKIKSFLGVQTAFVSAKSKNKELSWDLLKYLTETTPEGLAVAGNRIPVTKAGLELDVVKNNEYTQAFIKQAQNAIPMPNIVEMQSVWAPAKSISRVLKGEDASVVAKEIVDGVKKGIATQQ